MKIKIKLLNCGLVDVDGEDYLALNDLDAVLGDFAPMDNLVADIAGGRNN